jgi:hypothetical protein
VSRGRGPCRTAAVERPASELVVRSSRRGRRCYGECRPDLPSRPERNPSRGSTKSLPRGSSLTTDQSSAFPNAPGEAIAPLVGRFRATCDRDRLVIGDEHLRNSPCARLSRNRRAGLRTAGGHRIRSAAARAASATGAAGVAPGRSTATASWRGRFPGRLQPGPDQILYGDRSAGSATESSARRLLGPCRA